MFSIQDAKNLIVKMRGLGANEIEIGEALKQERQRVAGR